MILVYGTVCLDRVRRVPYLPETGGYVEIDSEVELPGGEASNTATALFRWGVPTRLLGNPIGSDATAARLRNALVRAGLPVDQLEYSEGPAPVCDIYVTPDGGRTMFGWGFRALDQVDRVANLPLVPGSWFTAEPNHGATARAAVRHALAAGLRTYLLDFIQPDDPVAPGSVWQSSTDWAGKRGDIQHNREWVQAHTDRYGCWTILSDGPNGLVAATPTDPARHFPPFPCPHMVDSTGAGDIFRAAMLHAMTQGAPWGEALSLASAAGCLNCRALGATTAIPSWDEVLALVAAHPSIADAYASAVGPRVG